MTFGISTITNANDEVIIDDSHVPLRIVSEGSVSKGSDNIYRVPVPGGLNVDPIIFVAWPIGDFMLANIGIENGTYNIAGIGSSPPANLSYWACALQPINSAGVGYGMAIYDAAGAVMFSSGVKHMRMKGLINAIGTGQPIESNGPFSHVSTPTLYPMTVPHIRVVGEVPPVQLPPFGGWVIAGGRRISATSFQFDNINAVPKNQLGDLPGALGGSEFILIGSVV